MIPELDDSGHYHKILILMKFDCYPFILNINVNTFNFASVGFFLNFSSLWAASFFALVLSKDPCFLF